MKRRLIFSGAALGCLVASIVSLKGQGGTGSVMREARVTQIVKDVKIQASNAEPRPATTSDTVRGDTAVRTGADSRAELTFGDLTIARLGANTIFSFNEGSRTVDLGNGAILLRVPKGSGGAKIQTAAVTAAITGTTVIAEYHPKSYAKYLVLEGTMRLYMKGILGESVLLHAGQMMILNPNATRLSEPVDFDLERLLKTSLFIQGFRPLPSVPLLAAVQQTQLEQKAAGELIDTNLVIFGRGTLVTMTDPQASDVIDRKTAAVTLPTPTATPTAPPPTPTATPTAMPTATPTATPKPSKFGTPPPIVTFVPYPIDNSTTIQTDPMITHSGVDDFGKIYRDSAQDGPFSTWAFTATSPFDTTVGIDALYGPNVPVAAFKFVALQLVGDPIISTANGGATNLALISVGAITTATSGNATFTFAGMQSLLLATQNGSIDITSPDISFQGIPQLFFYARGTGSNLTLGGMGIFGTNTLRLMAENNIQISAPESLTNGANGGALFGIAGGGITVNSPIDTPTAFVAPGVFSGSGGTVSLSASGTITLNSRIQTSYDSSAGTASRGASGGIIGLNSSLTTGTGISLSATSSLLSLLNTAAPGPGGSITLMTAGSDIITNGATIEADRGTITIQHPIGASNGDITLNNGIMRSETFIASSGRDLSVGSSAAVNLSVVTLSLAANRNITWMGGTQVATATNSSGNVFVQAGNNITIIGTTDIERFNGGIMDGLNLRLNAGATLQTNSSLVMVTDGGGLTTGGNILLNGATINFGGVTTLATGPRTADQGVGSNIGVTAGGPLTVRTFSSFVQIGAGRTLGNGGSISLFGTGSFTATASDGGFDLSIDNAAAGTIGTGGNINLGTGGDLSTGTNGSFDLGITNSNGGRINTGANITSTVGGNFTAALVNVGIDNSLKGFIGTGASLTFTVNGTLKTTSDANVVILNSQIGTAGGTITSTAKINLTLGGATIGRNFNVYVDNSDGSIGPGGDDWTVRLQINGTLAVTGRINVFGDLTSTGAVNAGTLSATNINAPSISVGAGGITRFSFPNEITINPLHTITTNSLMSTGGINFDGTNFDTPPGFGPFDGGMLTINVPSLTFGSSAADNIQGPVTFNGGSSPNNTIPAGNGGTFVVNASGAITVNNPITATTGLRTADPPDSGTGGNVSLNSTGGTISVSAPIQVSSNETPGGGVPIRKSNAGGTINLKSDATGVAINISNTGQLLSLLEGTAAGPGGKITILATAANSRVNVTGDPGSAGKPPLDTIRADKGIVDIQNTGDTGSITLNTAQISADTVKIGAFGKSGSLTIGGGRISADTILKLYATGTNGSVIFISDVTLAGNSLKIIAGGTVTVNNGVTVQVSKQPADIYVPDVNHANYSNFNGGNNTTNGVFIIEGTAGSPVSGANTHPGVAPPGF